MQQSNDTGLTTTLKSLVEELDRTHSSAMSWAEEPFPPAFVTAENGIQRHYTKKARTILSRVAESIFKNRKQGSTQIAQEDFEKIVYQAVADMHAAGEFKSRDENEIKKRLRRRIEERISKEPQEYTHFFPARTLGMEKESPFVLGPVTFLSPSNWIESVDFPLRTTKRDIRDALKGKYPPSDELAQYICDAISEYQCLAKVTVFGYNLNLSRKLARQVAKTALDAISLALNAPEYFHQQALHEERLPPIKTHSLVAINGKLQSLEISLGKQIPLLSPACAKRVLTSHEHELRAFGDILEGVVNPSSHSHPKLASRWATALNWYGEGNRESDDAIALAKLAISLDVLCGGGKAVGITNMLTHLTGIEKVIYGTGPRPLKKLVEDIYGSGRSRIVHGNSHDRLESFSINRQNAAHFARLALIEGAIRLQKYTGTDDNAKTFQTIPK